MTPRPEGFAGSMAGVSLFCGMAVSFYRLALTARRGWGLGAATATAVEQSWQSQDRVSPKAVRPKGTMLNVGRLAPQA